LFFISYKTQKRKKKKKEIPTVWSFDYAFKETNFLHSAPFIDQNKQSPQKNPISYPFY
jgi:hypothetical protein